MKCNICGDDIPNGANVCPSCGTPVNNGQTMNTNMNQNMSNNINSNINQGYNQNYNQTTYNQNQMNNNNNNSDEGNTLSIVGLIFSFFIPILGLILSIIGNNKYKQSTGKSNGCAIAGIVISSIFLAVFVFVIIISLAFSTLLWPNVRSDIIEQTYCNQAYNCNCVDDECTCSYDIEDEDGNKEETKSITCSKDSISTSQESTLSYQ